MFPKLKHFAEFDCFLASEGASVKQLICVGRIPSEVFIRCLKKLLALQIAALRLLAVFEVLLVVFHWNAFHPALMARYFN